MREEILITGEAVGRKFCRNLKRSLYYGVCDMMNDLRGHSGQNRELRKGEFWAVQDVNFELRRGQCMGLIGRNGAGKTTLLKVLSGLIKPDSGRVTVRGEVGALIALGAGFNPILSGRENIYVNASLLGLDKRTISSLIEEIVDFSGIGEFIDAPVQSYSSGMQVRLGFAVATALQPDVLILDEVLAVGDAAFRNKCYNRIGKMLKHAAVIFVSHSMEQVAHVCDKAMVLHQSRCEFVGDVNTAIQHYHRLNEAQGQDADAFLNLHAPAQDFRIDQMPESAVAGSMVTLKLKFAMEADLPDPWLRVLLYTANGLMLAEWDNHRVGQAIELCQGEARVEVTLGPLLLKPGSYSLGIQLSDTQGLIQYVWSFKQYHLTVTGREGGHGWMQFESRTLHENTAT